MEFLKNFVVGSQGHKREAPPEGMINQSDRAISRVHCANDANVPWYSKPTTATQRDFLISILQKVHELTKYAGQIRAINFINDEYTPVSRGVSPLTEFEKSSWNYRVIEP